MMFAHTENVQAHLLGVFDAFDQLAQTFRAGDVAVRAGKIRRKTINAKLHG